MARRRPHGRTKSDHRACQEARFARASEYRERTSISAEKQEALIAAANTQQESAEPLVRRRRGQSSKADVNGQRFYGLSAPCCCSSAGGIRKAAKRHLSHTLNASAFKDPHALHCHDCGTGLRGGKEGGELKDLCRGHGPHFGFFLLDKDRAAWVSNRAQRRLEAEAAWREEQLWGSRDAPPVAVWDGTCLNGASYTAELMSPQLLAVLLKIGGVESNPGPLEKDPGYEPTSPRYTVVRTAEQVLAAQAASDKRQRTGEYWHIGGFVPGHSRPAEDQPEAPPSHGLADPSSFRDFQRKLREEMEQATAQGQPLVVPVPEANDIIDQQASGAVNGEENQGAEGEGSEGEGSELGEGWKARGRKAREDIEGAEFEPDDEPVEKETSQHRALIDDSSQHEENPLIVHGRLNADLESASESDGQIVKRKFKPRVRRPRQRRVVDLPPHSSSDERRHGDLQNRSPAADLRRSSHESGGLPADIDLSVGEGSRPDAVPNPSRDGAESRRGDGKSEAEEAENSASWSVSAARFGEDVGESDDNESGSYREKKEEEPTDFELERLECALGAASITSLEAGGPQPANEAPVQEALTRENITARAERYVSLGYAVFSATIFWNAQTGKKGVWWPPQWQCCTLQTSLASFVQRSSNALIVNTTSSGVLVVDIDAQDRGLEAWAALEDAHGRVEAPRVRTGSGGEHLYFSHEKSLEAGLKAGASTSFSKLELEGLGKVGIDMRGTSSSACAILPPTAYTAVLDGTPQTLRYEVLGGSELAPVGELPALPAWLVEILNKRGVRPVPSRQQRGAEARDGASSDSEPLGEPEPDLLSEELQAEVVSELKRMLSSWGDNVSVFAMAVPSSTGRGVLYQFRNGGGGRADCPYFPASQGLHDSNNFALWRRGVEITYLCFGERCKVVPRDSHIRLGILSFPVAAAFGDSQPLNSYRDHLYSDRELLPLAFLKENLNAAKGDVGGANILERIYLRTGLKFVYTPNGSYYWSGTCWIKDESGGRLQRVFREELTKVAKAYRKEKGLGEFAPNPTSKEELLEQKKKKESLVNFDFNSRMSNVLATSKEYFFQSGFEGKLDQRKDHRVVANGVIDLRTGKLERHHPRFLNSCTLEWPFPEQGLDYPKGRMLEFLESIMFVNGVDGRAAVEHLQILLGYGFTGHTSNQVLAIFMGEGSAGKSALLQLLRKLLGPAYKDVGKEMVVNARGQRAASKGAASPLEAGLRGILLAVIEETNQSDTLDEAGVKKLTGTDIITARPLYKDFITFSANMLLILCTNNLPRTEAEWTVALRRRLQLVVFPRRYFASHERGYEPENPLHGLVNPRLTTELSASQHMQELLVWLVEGAVKWYRNGQQLGTMPARSLEALEMYEEENDDFQKFVIYSCETGRDYFIGTTEAIEAYNDPGRMVDGKLVEFVDRIGATKLKKLMNARGFKGPGKPSDLGLQMPGCETRGYRGLRLKTLVG